MQNCSAGLARDGGEERGGVRDTEATHTAFPRNAAGDANARVTRLLIEERA